MAKIIKDYDEGLLLLSRFCKNRALILSLSRKKNPAKLDYELNKIAKKQKRNVAPGFKVVKPESHSDKLIGVMNKDREKLLAESVGLKVIRNKHAVNYEDIPEEFQKLWDVNRDAAKEIRALHEKLKLMEKASPEDRQPLTLRITQLDEILHANWETINKWEPGMPVVAKVVEKSTNNLPVMDFRRINANRKYISTGVKRILAGCINADKLQALKQSVLARFSELKSAGIEMTPDSLDELKKTGINI
jgi:hypothetical protein